MEAAGVIARQRHVIWFTSQVREDCLAVGGFESFAGRVGLKRPGFSFALERLTERRHSEGAYKVTAVDRHISV